ncbi:MAG: hypothetical protein Kow0099_11180 [Candidatus Abyssubacteria bacterium]
MKFEFDHVHLNSSNAEEAAKFYVNTFGGQALGEHEVAGTRMLVVAFGGTRLLINDRAPNGPPAGTGVDHIGFRVADLDAAAAELKQRGADFALEPVSLGPDVKIAFVSGPDNIMIELSEEGARA